MNTFVWGFNDKIYQEVINKLSNEGVIDIKKWIINKEISKLNENQLYMHSFLARNNWDVIYKDLVKSCFSDIKINTEVYDKIYKTFDVYFNFESRFEKYGNTSYSYYLNKFNLLFKFLYSIFIKDKIELVLFSNLPHLGIDWIIYNLAKIMGIRTILLINSSIPYNYNKFFYMEDIEDYGDFKCMKSRYEHAFSKIKKTQTRDLFYMKFSMKKTWKNLSHQNPLYAKYKKYREFLKKINSIAEPVDYTKKYVYFPLHLQPELTTSTLGGKYCDQLLALERLSEVLPEDWVIYVKENPKQTEYLRDKNFFSRLKLIEKVKVTPRDESSIKLIQNSQFISTITGTAGYEALNEGKPVLVFGRTWYQNFEGAFKWNDNFNINDIINYQINPQKLEQDYNELLSRMPYGVTDPDYIKAITDFDEGRCIESLKNVLKEQIQKREGILQ